MKALPSLADLPYDNLCDIGASYVDSFKIRFLMAALKVKLFDYFNSETSAADIITKTGYDSNATTAVLDVLTAMGLLKKTDGKYINSETARTYFVSDRETYFGETLVLMNSMYDPVYGSIDTILKDGFPKGARSMASGSEHIWALQARKISKMHCSGVVQKIVETVIKQVPEWPSFKKMLDVGGSSGLYTIGFVNAHPELQGVVFDQPAVVKVAEETIREYGLDHRISTLGGSFTDGPIGSGYDFIWASDSLNFAWHQLEKPVSLVYEALNSGGVFISNHFHVAKDKSGPLNGVLFSAWHWLAGDEMYFYENQMAGEMLGAGFRQVQTVPFTSVLGFGQMDIARK
jgi:predicted O-methyltransferase YrrM